MIALSPPILHLFRAIKFKKQGIRSESRARCVKFIDIHSLQNNFLFNRNLQQRCLREPHGHVPVRLRRGVRPADGQVALRGHRRVLGGPYPMPARVCQHARVIPLRL